LPASTGLRFGEMDFGDPGGRAPQRRGATDVGRSLAGGNVGGAQPVRDLAAGDQPTGVVGTTASEL